MNQLQAVALTKAYARRKLWREEGREQLESSGHSVASRRRHHHLELLDRLDPAIAALSQAIEQKVEKCPEANACRPTPEWDR